MIGLSSGNLASYSLQAGALLLAGGVTLQWLRIRPPALRLHLWQALLLIALLFPLAQPRKARAVQSPVPAASTSITVVPGGPSAARVPLSQVFSVLLIAGTAARFGFLALGFWRLSRYRRQSRPAPGGESNIQRRMGIRAEVRTLESIPGPVTFGVLRPVIVLPQRWLGNESILCHELIHVRRRDWLITAVEESIRALFWFHPLVWWAIAKIQLAREETVDREAVQFTDSRVRYLQTLLEIAAAQAGLPFAPAPLFLRNRHLRQRVASLMKEVTMSRKRLNFSLAGFAAALFAGGWIAVHAFPLQAAPPQTGVPLADTGLRATHKAAPQYPEFARKNHIEGDVAILILVDAHGLVSDAKVISGPEELRDAALTAVRQWSFSPSSAVPGTAEVVINFRLDSDAIQQDQAPLQPDAPKRIRVGGNVVSANLINKVTPIYPAEAKAQRLQGVVRLNVLIAPDGMVEDVVLIQGHPLLAEAAIPAVWQWVYRPTLLNGEPVEVITHVDVNFTLAP